MASSLEVKSPLTDEASLNALTNSQSAPGLSDPISSAPRAAVIADRASAFFWRNAVTDQTGVWGVQGTTYQSSNLFQNMPALGSNSDWKLVDAGSFLNGGENTLLWRNAATDQTAVWFVNETGYESGFFVTGAPSLGSNSPWKLVGGVTLNDAPTLVWRNQASDQTAVWAFNTQGQFQSGSFLTGTPALGANSPWQLIDAVENQGQLELLWRNQGTDATAVWNFNGTAFTSGALVSAAPALGNNSPWQLAKFVDVDGNGSADLVWQNRTSGQQAVWFLNGTTYTSGELIKEAPRPDANWQIAGVVSVDLAALSPNALSPDVRASQAAVTASELPVTENLIWANNAIGQSAAWGINTDDLSAVFVNGTFIQDAPALGQNSPWKLIDAINKADGSEQFLWRNQSSDETAIWNIQNNRFVSGNILDTPKLGSNSPWQLVGNAILGDSDQTTLVWRNQATDQTAVWTIGADYKFASGKVIEAAPSLGGNSPWTLVDIANSNGDLILLWRNQATDQTGLWAVNDGQFSSAALLKSAPQLGGNSPWQLVKLEDVNNNGSLDLIWQNFSTREQAVWYLENDTYLTGKLVSNGPLPDANWKIVGSVTPLDDSSATPPDNSSATPPNDSSATPPGDLPMEAL